MTKKLPKDLIPGEASDNSIVHASDSVVDLSRGHKEVDISRLQSTAHNFDGTKQYKIDDLTIYAEKLYRCIIVNTVGSFIPEQWKVVSGGTATIDYDSTKSYQKGESAVWFKRIIQITLVDIPVNTPYNPESWTPVNIKRTTLLDTITVEPHKHEVTVTAKTTTGIVFRDKNFAATIPFLEVGDFISIVGTDGSTIVGAISSISTGITADYDVELTSSDIAKITETDQEITFLNRTILTGEIKGVILNKKDYTDDIPHLVPVDITLVDYPVTTPPTTDNNNMQFLVSKNSPTTSSLVTNNDYTKESLTEDNLYIIYFSKLHYHIFQITLKNIGQKLIKYLILMQLM